MLDIAFGELMVIGVVALVVLGPERLPRVARTAGHLLGRFQRYVSEVKADINREIELADLKRLQTTVEDAARSIETSVRTGMDEAQKELRSAEDEFKQVQAQVQTATPTLEMPHMGMAAGLGTPAVTPATDAQVSSAEPVASSASADEVSPQMELGLSGAGAPETTKHG
jgi:sec-independent protein translocase protein TatB